MKFRRIILKTVTLLSLASISVEAFGITYVVKERETLSQIAHRLIPGPIYGTNGSLQKLLAENPQIKNPDFIVPQDELNYGVLVSREEIAPAVIEVEGSEVDRSVSNEFRRGDAFSIKPYFEMTTLTATDIASGSRAKFYSSSSFGLDAEYSQTWSEDFQSLVHFKVGKISFEPPTSANRSFEESSKTIFGFGLGVNYSLSERVEVALNVDLEKEIYSRAVSSGKTTFDTIMTPQALASVFYGLVQLHPFTFGVGASGGILFAGSSDSYDVKSGTQYRGILYLRRNSDHGGPLKYQVELGAGSRSQNTSIADQSQTDFSLSFKYLLGGSEFKRGAE